MSVFQCFQFVGFLLHAIAGKIVHCVWKRFTSKCNLLRVLIAMVGRALEWVCASLDKVPGGFLPVGGGLRGTKSFYSELQTFLTFVSWTRLSIWTSSQTVNIWPGQTEMNTNQVCRKLFYRKLKTMFLKLSRIHKSEASCSFSSLLGLLLLSLWIVIRIWLWADPFLSVPVLYRNWPPQPPHKSFNP